MGPQVHWVGVPGESKGRHLVCPQMDWSALALVVVLVHQDKVGTAVVAVADWVENQFVAGAGRLGFVGGFGSESGLQTKHLAELLFQFATFQGDHLGLGY